MGHGKTATAIRRLIQAAAFAAEKHRDQRRKGVEAAPYINHPIEVARVLAFEGDVTDVDVLCAAILHDTVEDTQTTFEELRQTFGESVESLVREVTDDKSLSKEARKQLQVEHAPHLTNKAKLVKLADKICNVRDIVRVPPADWSQQRKGEYFEWAAKVVVGLRGANPELEATFDRALLP